MLSRPYPAWVHQVARFLVVGGSATAIDGGILALLIHWGGSAYAARLFSVAVSIVFTWGANRRVTFATTVPPNWREFGHYVVVALAGIALNLSIYWSALGLGAPIWVGFVLGSGLTAVFSFFRYRALFGK